MLKTGLKNFFKNLLYVFVPMGIFYLFLILVLFGLFGKVGSDLGNMLDDIIDLVSDSIDSSGATVKEFAEYSSSQLDTEGGLFSILEQIFSTSWLKDTICGFFDSIGSSVDGFSSDVDKITESFATSLIGDLAVAVAFLFVGIYFADFFTAMLLRRKAAKRSVKQTVLNFVLHPLFSSFLTFALVLVTAKIRAYTLLVIVAVIIAYEICTFTFAWIIYRDGNLKLATVLNYKNLGMNFLVTVIILAINLAVFFVAWIINVFLAILLIIPLLIYSMRVLTMNADSYVYNLVNGEIS